MRRREFDPRRLDVTAFSREGGTLSGQIELASFDRLRDALHPDAQPGPEERIDWTLGGTASARAAAGDPAIALRLAARGRLSLVCQRCLGPVSMALSIERGYRFERDEDRAAVLDAEIDDDVMVLGDRFDVVELVEDELLLSLPLVPRHKTCPEPLPTPSDTTPAAAGDERVHPFAALSALRDRGEDPSEGH